jgi:hypothetical protein
MVAYSFQRRFVNPIRVGLRLEPLADFPPAAGPKRHTIRAPRLRNHASEGQPLELYFAQRTQYRFLIASTICTGRAPITLVFDSDPEFEGVISLGLGIAEWGYGSLDAFAVGDGFENWAALRQFWMVKRAGDFTFTGTIIFWNTNK